MTTSSYVACKCSSLRDDTVARVVSSDVSHHQNPRREWKQVDARNNVHQSAVKGIESTVKTEEERQSISTTTESYLCAASDYPSNPILSPTADHLARFVVVTHPRSNDGSDGCSLDSPMLKCCLGGSKLQM